VQRRAVVGPPRHRLASLLGQPGRDSDVGSIQISPTDQPTLGVPLDADGHGVCTVVFTAATLRIPALVQPGSKDTRRLGAHFFSFGYSR